MSTAAKGATAEEMALQKISADFDDRARALQAASILQDLVEPAPDALSVFEGAGGVWRLEAYFSQGLGARDLGSEMAALADFQLPPLASSDVPDLNWVAMSQAALPPVEAGRFVIFGSHDRTRVRRGPGAILIDAGEAFGTAHHATTLSCLLAVDRLTRATRFQTVLDLGTGSGVLAIAVAKALPAARIVATDLDGQSVKVAEQNMRLNGVAHRIAITQAEGVRHRWLRQSPPVDLVIANILAGPLISLAAELRTVVRPGGTLVLSGVLVHQAPQVTAAYRACGFHIDRHDRMAGWSALTLRRR